MTDDKADAVVGRLRAAVRGPVLVAGDDGYRAELTAFDLSLVHSPTVVVAAASADDVQATVRIAAAAGVPIIVIGSGHGDIPPVTDGIVLNVRRINEVQVDSADRSARIGAGATWHDVMARSVPAGLAPVAGSAPAVGVGGFLLGGGMGPIGRAVGFSSDHLRSIEMVGADGGLHLVTAADKDLYWALRGGKGGFGVVTAVTVELLELPSIYGGGEYYPAADIPALLRAFQSLVNSGVPNALTISVAVLRLPDIPVIPKPLRGQTVAHLRVGYVGDPADRAGWASAAEELLAPLRAAVTTPILGRIGELSYADIGTIHNDPTVPSAHATAGILLTHLEPETIEAILSIAGPDARAPLAIVEIRHLGGAFAGSADRPDAVSGREAAFGMWVSGAPMPADFDPTALTATAGEVRGVLDAVAPWSTGVVQINFCGSVNTAAEADGAWPAEVSDRLGAIRRRYDPHGLFPFVPGSAPVPPG